MRQQLSILTYRYAVLNINFIKMMKRVFIHLFHKYEKKNETTQNSALN